MPLKHKLEKGTCASCDAFVRFSNQPKLGKCIRHAPTAVICRYVPIARMDSKGQMVQVLEGQIDGAFPSTQESLTCREYVEDVLPLFPEMGAGLTAFDPAQTQPEPAANDAVAEEAPAE